MTTKTAPNSTLKLDWVYGYRGFQCHNNLYYTKEDKIVYFVAGIGIVFDTKLQKQFYYFEHNDDIISLAMANDGDTVATGQIGKSPHICVWSSITMQTRSILRDQHTHGICSLAFSGDGTLLVSIGLDPNATMNVWDWKKGKVLSTTRAHSDRVFDVRFISNDGNPTFVSCGVKHIKFWTLTGNALTAKKGIFGKVGEIQTMLTVCISINDKTVSYSGSANGDVYVWRNNTLERVLPTVHQGSVFTIERSSEGYVTGGKDGCIVLFDLGFQQIMKINLKETSVGYPDLIVRSVHRVSNKIIVGSQGSDIIEVLVPSPTKPRTLVMGHAAGELWALAVHPKKPIFATGSDDCSVRIWQITDKGCLSVLRIDKKIRSCGFNNDGSLLAIGLMDGSFRVIRSKDMSEIARFQDRKEVIHELKFSPDGKWLAVGSNDNFVDFYDAVGNFKRLGTCKGNSSFITHLDWSVDSTFIKTNSGAAECLIFKAPGGEHVIQTETLKSIRWQQSTGVLGPEILGIWEKYTDTNDINGADVNFSAEVIATGDDFGLVKIFRYPSTLKGAHFKKYTGHSSHVTNVRWSFDGKHLITIGGADQSIFQWSLVTGGANIVDGSGYQGDSNTEGSDSGLSDVQPCNSDIEAEAQTNYTRIVSKEEVTRFQKVTKTDLEEGTKRKNAPSQGLDLEWVHGYRGYDCRNNLFYLRSGEIVYHIAAVAIVLNTNTKSQRFYTSHTDDILCLALHPTKELVATGEVGKSPTIHIWEADKMKVASILKGQHERGVCALDFSHDGKRLASVGLDDNHCIVVWNWKTGEKLASTRSHNDKVFVIKWDPHNDDNLVTVGMKYIQFWKQVGGGFTGKRGTYGTVSKLDTQLCAAFSPTTPGICYTGGANSLVYVWKDNILQSTIPSHQGGCYAIDAMNKGYVTGGKDGSINLYDETFGKVCKSYKLTPESLVDGDMLSTSNPGIRSVMLGKGNILIGTNNGEILEISVEGRIHIVVQGHGEGELWGLAVHPSMNICCSVSDDCNLMVWQIQQSNHRLMRLTKLKGPARCCDISSDGSAVAVGFKDGSFAVFGINNLKEITSNHHRKEEISDIRFSPAPGKYLAVASHDNFVDIYSVTSHQRLSVCKGCSSYITHIDWDENGKLLMVNSGAKEQLFFEVPRGNRQTIARSELEKMKWSSWTSVLGDSCVGIWPPRSDVTDINGASLTSDGSLLATGDDFGRVKLFEFPAKTKFAKYKQYMGHSAHVTNVRWLKNDEYLLSIGGADTALMVWKHRRAPLTPHETTLTKKADGHQSQVSDTDSEEEHGFDSDVQREKNMDYRSKTYSGRLALQQKEFLKPAITNGTGKKDNLKSNVSRDATVALKVMSPITFKQSQIPQDDSLKKSRGIGKTGSTKSVTDLPLPVLPMVNGLSLTHIHGYRGFDCRNNLHYVDTEGTVIVYHAAAVCIVHNLATGKQTFFMEHTDDILCLTVNRHPKYKGVTASGQLGDIPEIHIWNTADCTLMSTIRGTHTCGVCSLDFSSTGSILVSVGIDSDHTIAVWKWKEGSCLASSRGHVDRIFLAEFRPDSDTLFVDVGVKHVKFWTVAGSQLVSKNGVIPETIANKPRMTTMLSVAFGTDDVTYTGAMSGAVWVWKSGVLIRQVEKAHSGPVFVLYTTLVDGLIVSGGKEKLKDTGSVKLWDQDMNRCKPFHLVESMNVRSSGSTTGTLEEKTFEIVRSIARVKGKILLGTQDNDILEINEKTGAVEYLMQSHGEGLLGGLAIHPFLPRYASASEDGTVRIWDLNTKMLIQNLTTGSACSLNFSPNGQHLAIGLKSGAFIVLSANSYRLLIRKKDRGKPIIDIKFSPNGSTFAASSEDNVIDIYQIMSNTTVPSGDGNTLTPTSNFAIQRLSYCKDLGSAAKQMDFSVDSQFIRCTLIDYTTKVYSAITGQLCIDPLIVNKIIWSSWSSIVGDEVSGIWPDNSEKADVNIAVISHQNNCTVTGDDYGLVKLFPDFPVKRVDNRAAVPRGIYRGHSANVTNVRFMNDDSHLLSTGGDDCCVFVWKCS